MTSPNTEATSQLFHYTSVNALEAILKSDMVWATDVAYLNDSSEMKMVWSAISQTCRDCIMHLDPSRQAEEVDEIVKFVVPVMRQSVLPYVSGDPSTVRMFVASFSSHTALRVRQHGLLSQWRGYCGSEPVALVFDADRLEELLDRENERFSYLACGLRSVIYRDYNDWSLEEEFPKLTQALYDFVDSLMTGRSPDSPEVQENQIGGELPWAAAGVKHWGFEEEAERRIVVARPPSSFAQELELPLKSIHHRSSHRGLIPYVRLFETPDDLTPRRLPINGVIVGPSHNQRALVETVREIVARHDRRRGIKVSLSEIPFVGTS